MMTRRFHWRWWVTGLVAAAAALGAPWAGPSNQLDPANLPPEWRALIQTLQAPATVRSTFTERRLLGFRSRPIVLSGELRLVRNEALSLHYLDPDDRTVIVDSVGVLLRDARGRSRAAPAEAVESIEPLLRALHFDLPALAETFTVHGWREGAEWKLALEPRSTGSPPEGGGIEITGSGGSVDSIYLVPSSRRRIAITLVETEVDVTFSTKERQRYFR